ARRAERELARKLDELNLLLQVTNSVTSQLDLKELFKIISDCVRRFIQCDGSSIMIYDPESALLRVHTLRPGFELKAPISEGTLVPIEGTAAGAALKTLQPLIVTTADLETYTSPLVKRVREDGVKSGCVAPLVSHGRALGTIDIVSLKEDNFNKED